MRLIQTIFRKLILNEITPGFKYLYIYPDAVSRCFWGTTLCSIMSFTCLMTYLLYNRFVELPTRINIENQYEPAAEMPFPSICLCSPNQISIKAVEHLNKTLVDGNRTRNLEVMLRQLLGFFDLVELNENDLNELQQLLELNRYAIPEVVVSLAQGCDQFLKFCQYNGRIWNCNELFKPILTQEGVCCIFNNMYSFQHKRRNEANKNFKYHKVRETGMHQGLSVVTDFEPEDAVDESIMINAWNEFPADDKISFILPKAETIHSIYMTHTYCSDEVTSLTSNSRDCLFRQERVMPFFGEYHNSDCDLYCFAEMVLKKCHCLVLYLPRLKLSMACNVTSIICITQVKEQLGKYECDCPRDCDFIEYKMFTTVGNLDGLPYMVVDPFANSGVVFKSSTTFMHFFLPMPVYVKQKQETVMSLTSVVANVGGVFGLCLGMSAICVIEQLYIVYAFFKAYRHARHGVTDQRSE